MGLAPSGNRKTLDKSLVAKVPVPIFHSLSVVRTAGSDQGVQFLLQSRQDLVVAECAQRFAAAFQIHVIRSAPQPQIGIVGFAGSVHAAAHDGDRQRVVFGVGGHRLDLLSQLDKGFVFDARATGARDDVQRFGLKTTTDRTRPAAMSARI
jgi:hypothetical protein